MAKKFPKKLFVKIDTDTDTEYFVADEGIDGMVEVGQKVQIALYQLVEVNTAEGLVKVHPPARRRS